ncbi:MAG: DUF2304 domain-containing protein [Planctomycetota bacterium]
MNLFQWIVLPLLALVMIFDMQGLRKRRGNFVLRVARMIAWSLAFVMIANPAFTTAVSRFLGIGRGTDFVVYVFMLVAPLMWFRSQAQIHGLQRQIVELARVEAMRNARHPNDR